MISIIIIVVVVVVIVIDLIEKEGPRGGGK
jgi:hypothetical protein